MTPTTVPLPRNALLLVAALVLLAPPLAGCIGQTTGGNATGPPEVDPDLRPHTHDRWFDVEGAPIDRYTVVNRSVQVNLTEEDDEGRPALNRCRRPDAPMGDVSVCLGDAVFTPGTRPDGEGRIVPPGTSHLEINLTFSADDFEQVRMYYRDARDPAEWKAVTNESLGGPFEPGGDARRVNVTVRQADDGHAHVSMWTFMVMAEGNPYVVGGGVLSVGSGAIDVDVVAVRGPGPLPLEPAHPQWWGEDAPPTRVYHVGALEDAVEGYVQAGPVYGETGQPSPSTIKANGRGVTWQFPVGFEARAITPRYGAEYPAKLNHSYAEALVPPGTRLMAVTVVAEGEVVGTAPEVCLWGQDTPGRGYPGEQLAECQTLEPGTETTFLRPMSGRDVDSFYTNTSSGLSMSRWTLYLQIIAPDGGVADFDGTVRAHVFVTDRARLDLPPWARALVEGQGSTSVGNGTATAAWAGPGAVPAAGLDLL